MNIQNANKYGNIEALAARRGKLASNHSGIPQKILYPSRTHAAEKSARPAHAPRPGRTRRPKVSPARSIFILYLNITNKYCIECIAGITSNADGWLISSHTYRLQRYAVAPPQGKRDALRNWRKRTNADANDVQQRATTKPTTAEPGNLNA